MTYFSTKFKDYNDFNFNTRLGLLNQYVVFQNSIVIEYSSQGCHRHFLIKNPDMVFTLILFFQTTTVKLT